MGTVYNTNVVTDGLMSCWDAANRKSYPGTGTSWAALGAGSAGTLENEPPFVDGKMGYFTFDGTDEYAEFELDTLTLSEGSSGSAYDESTIVLWVQWGPGDTNGCILAANHPSGGDTTDNGFRYSSWGFYNSSGGDVKWISGVGDTGATDWGLAEGEWAQITIRCRFNSSGTPYYTTYMKVWINGIEVYEGGGPSGYYLNEGAFRIASGEGACWEGSLASIHVYNRELTDAEVLQNYEATKNRFLPRITKSGMLANWDAGDPASYPGGTTLKNTVSGTAATFVNMDGSNFNSANGGYWDFDGTNETIDTNSLFNARTLGFTGTAWVKMTGDKVDNAFFWQNYVAQFRYDSANKLNFSEGLGTSWGGAQDILSAADLIADDTWVHVAAVYDSSDDGRKLYLNGAVVATDTSVITGSQTAPSITMHLGSHENSTGFLLDGSIAQVILYQGALSDGQIIDNYNKTKARFGH